MTSHEQSPDVAEPRLLTQQEVADRLGVSLATLRRIRTVDPDGRDCYALFGQLIPILRLSARHVRVSSHAVDQAIRQAS